MPSTETPRHWRPSPPANTGDRLWCAQVDVTDAEALRSALSTLCTGNPGGGLDMMRNNAGIGQSGWFEDIPYEVAMRVVDINVRAVLTGAYACLP